MKVEPKNTHIPYVKTLEVPIIPIIIFFKLIAYQILVKVDGIILNIIKYTYQINTLI